MNGLPALKTALLLTLTTLLLAACGGGSQSGQSPESGEAAGETVQESAPAETTQESGAQESTGSEEMQGDQGTQEEASGPSVTTLDGEEVSIGEGEATALFFMAGW